MSGEPGAPRHAVLVSVSVAVLMIAQQLAGKALRDAFFLSHYEATSLPTVMIVASVVSVLAVVGASRLFRRIAPARLVPIVFALSAAWFGVEWALSDAAPRVAAASLYIHTTSFGAVVVSGFWSVINERFDPHSAKQVIGRIAGGATLGGVLGGLAAWQGAAFISIGGMVLVLAGANLVCGLGVLQLGGPKKPRAARDADAEEPSAFAIMEETPYLWHLASLVGLSALAAAAFDYVFKARAAATFDTSADLVSFFALFYLGLGVATFLFQQLFAKRALETLGLTATVATMPSTVVVLGVIALFAGGLWSVLLLRGGAAVIESSLYRSGYELLYTPLTPEKKRPTKTLIDVGGDKVGAAIGSGLALGVVALVPGSSQGILLFVAVGCGLGALALCGLLHRGYVASLADSLRSGAVDPTELEVADAVTQAAVNRTVAGVDRARLLEAMRAEAASPVGSLRPDLTRSEVEAAPELAIDAAEVLAVPLEVAEVDAPLRAIAALRSRDPQRVQAVLTACHPLPAELVPHAIACLADAELRGPIREALRQAGPVHTGALADALVGARVPLEVRLWLPSVLEGIATQRSVEALLAGLVASSFELRFRIAVALRHLTFRASRLTIDEDAVIAAVERAAAEARRAAPTSVAAAPAGRVLGFCFLLLSTILPPEPLSLALEAVADDDPARRGTGLEYLENVLPASTKDGLRPLFAAQEVAARANRPADHLLEEVTASARTGWADLGSLIARLQGAEASS